jgi:regulatory protein
MAGAASRDQPAGGTDHVQAAMGRALALLAARARTEREIRDRLRRRFSPGVVDQVVGRLKELGYVNDEAFAAAWIDARSGRRPTGPRRLRSELMARGVDDGVIKAALGEADEEAQQAVADAAAAALFARARPADPVDLRRQRVYTALLRRGFDHEQACLATARAAKEPTEEPAKEPTEELTEEP